MEGDKLAKDISKKPTGVLFVDRNRIYFYEQSLTTPLSLDLSPEIVSDLEIINKKNLDNFIKSFISSNNLVPCSVLILLSTSVTFEKEFPEGGLDINKGIEDFLELVPFEEYISKKVVISGKTKIVAANRDSFEAIRDSLKSMNFMVTAVFPLSFYLDMFPQLASNLDLGFVVEKSAEMKQFNLIPQVESTSSSSSSQKKEKPEKKQMKMLIAVFGLLIPILLFFVYQQFLPTPKPSNVLPPVAAPLPTVEPTLNLLPSITPIVQVAPVSRNSAQ